MKNTAKWKVILASWIRKIRCLYYLKTIYGIIVMPIRTPKKKKNLTFKGVIEDPEYSRESRAKAV